MFTKVKLSYFLATKQTLLTQHMDTLYILQGSTVTGVVVSLSEDPDLDTTHLYHMRLWHMSERGQYMLSKQS